MQEHLCQTLAHYLLYLGSKLGLSMRKDNERALIDAAPKRWERDGLFSWLINQVDDSDSNSESCSGSGDDEDRSMRTTMPEMRQGILNVLPMSAPSLRGRGMRILAKISTFLPLT